MRKYTDEKGRRFWSFTQYARFVRSHIPNEAFAIVS